MNAGLLQREALVDYPLKREDLKMSYDTFFMSSDALWPPKPKLLLMA